MPIIYYFCYFRIMGQLHIDSREDFKSLLKRNWLVLYLDTNFKNKSCEDHICPISNGQSYKQSDKYKITPFLISEVCRVLQNLLKSWKKVLNKHRMHNHIMNLNWKYKLSPICLYSINMSFIWCSIYFLYIFFCLSIKKISV